MDPAMDHNRVRTLGLLGGGGALVIALGVAALGGPGRDAAERLPDPPPVAGAVIAEPSVSATAPIPDVETATAEGPASRPVAIPQAPQKATPVDDALRNPNLEFIVRFDDRHPLSRAQALFLQGKRADAEGAAREILARRGEFAGLCFSRFTLGAEIVLAHCARVPRGQVQRTSDRWVRKLRAMQGVQYVDPNVIVQPETK
jgi:hypothetical protein